MFDLVRSMSSPPGQRRRPPNIMELRAENARLKIMVKDAEAARNDMIVQMRVMHQTTTEMSKRMAIERNTAERKATDDHRRLHARIVELETENQRLLQAQGGQQML